MCTATWFPKRGGFELFFNRDERLTRLPALAPREEISGGVRYLAPTDADAGGTWIAVNEFGLCLALLNAWQIEVPPPPQGFRSRGELVRGLAPCRGPAQLREEIARWDLKRLQGFSLLVLWPGHEPLRLGWDGASLEESSPRPPLVSSSRDAVEALRQRRMSFARFCASEGIVAPDKIEQQRAAFEAFHRSREPEPGPWAVCMQRDDARTVSASHVDVGTDAVSFRYADGPPDRTPFGNALVLARRSLEG